LLERAEILGERMQQHFLGLARKHHAIGDIRGLGAMVAVEFLHEGNTCRPAPEIAKALIAEARQRGLLLLGCGAHGNIVRIMAPLSIEDDILAEGLEIFSRALGAMV
jgi:4-aminobutyrate aminotransferase/4-aminobutyrate aminotransferase/(S)-3-amino-2-methylpropionate transaminase